MDDQIMLAYVDFLAGMKLKWKFGKLYWWDWDARTWELVGKCSGDPLLLKYAVKEKK